MRVDGGRRPAGAAVSTRLALYARVRSRGGRPQAALAVEQSRLLAAAAGWSDGVVVAAYADAAPGGRPGLARLRADAAARVFDVLVVTGLDRLGGAGRARTRLLAELAAAGVRVHPLGPTRRRRGDHQWLAVALADALLG